MTRDDIIRMALKAGATIRTDCNGQGVLANGIDVEEFAALVAAAERLSVKKDIEEEMTDELDDQAYHLCMELIAKILKRGAP